MNKAIFTVMLMLSFSLTGCIDDGQNDLQPESDVEPTIEPTGAADFDSLERRINELENETEELRYDNDKLGNRIVDLEANNSELMDSYEQLMNDYDDLANEIVSLNEQLEELENSGTDDSELLERIALLEQNIADLEEEVEVLMRDKDLLYNNLYLLRDINSSGVHFESGDCISGCSVYTDEMFDEYIFTTSEIGKYDNLLFFGAAESGEYRENSGVWVTDGSAFGTYKISDASRPTDFVTVDDGVFFFATDGEYGYELMFSDGTNDGTVRVSDDGLNCSYHNDEIYGSTGNTIFWGDIQYTNSCDGGSQGAILYSAHYTRNGVNLVPLDGENIHIVGYQDFVVTENKFFFSTRDYDQDITSLYSATRSNITHIETLDDNFRYDSFATINDIAYFSRGTNLNQSMWQTDGTQAGTFRVKSFQHNFSDSVFISSINSDSARDLIYISVTIIPDNGERSVDLFISDGTSEGTNLLIEGEDQYQYQFYQDETDSGVYFAVKRPSNYGDDYHFFILDENTNSLDFIFNETRNNYGGYLNTYVSILVRGDIYLRGDDNEHGQELWKIDLQNRQIGILHDINPGAGFSGLDSLTYFQGKIFFSAYSPSYGGEYWYITV